MALSLTEKVYHFLQQSPEQKFTAREIAERIFEKYPDEWAAKKARSKATVIPIKDKTVLLQQIIGEIASQRLRLQKRYSEIKTIESYPREYYFTESSDSDEVDNAENAETSLASQASTSGLSEHDLYPMLSKFLESELGIYSRRINEKKSKNSRGSGGNDWLHPDLVGMEDLSNDWNDEIKECVKRYGDKKTKLWSFEVKILINSSNVRKAFFQTVSNSSWANFGYLVAGKIEGKALPELRMLSSLHGIGVILLDVENPAESKIVIPARERGEIDWDNANRLAEENKDFLEYIKLIRQFYQANVLRKTDWGMKAKED